MKSKKLIQQAAGLAAALIAVLFCAVSCASLGGGGDFAWEDDPEFTPPDTAAAAPRPASDGAPAALRPAADGRYELSEDFERFAEGSAIPPGPLSGSVFAVSSNPAGGGTASIDIVADGGSKALKITHTGPVTGGQTRFFYKPAQELVDAVGLQKKAELEFRFKIGGTNGTVSLPYLYYTSTPNSAGLTANYNVGNGVFSAWNGNRQVSQNSFAKDEWHTFRAVLDYAASTFDLFVDGGEYVTAAAFRQDPGTPKDFGEVRFYLANVTGDNSLTLYLDDIKINAGF
jgi:hypothetical protein